MVVAGDEERIVAHAAYMRESAERAEVAFEVADDWQGRGIATILLAHLAEPPRARRHPHVHRRPCCPSNHRMIAGVPRLRVRRRGARAARRAAHGDARRRSTPAAPRALRGPRAHRRRGCRGARAAARVGRAGRRLARPGTVGAAVLAQPASRAASPAGCTSSIRAAKRSTASRPTARSPTSRGRSSSPSSPFPPPRSSTSRATAARAGVRALVVAVRRLRRGRRATAPRARRELLAICRAVRHAARRPELPRRAEHRPDVGLNATFAPAPPPPGGVAFASQSGAFGIAAIAEAARRGLGLSVVRVDRQQGRPVGQRPAPVLGGRRRHRRDRCSTSSPSATRAGSAASRGASAASKPVDRRQERPLGRRGARRRARTPARCSPPPT